MAHLLTDCVTHNVQVLKSHQTPKTLIIGSNVQKAFNFLRWGAEYIDLLWDPRQILKTQNRCCNLKMHCCGWKIWNVKPGDHCCNLKTTYPRIIAHSLELMLVLKWIWIRLMNWQNKKCFQLPGIHFIVERNNFNLIFKISLF